jgi:hypothetical protein
VVDYAENRTGNENVSISSFSDIRDESASDSSMQGD